MANLAYQALIMAGFSISAKNRYINFIGVSSDLSILYY
jgi:hypothetical protein